MSRRMAEEGWTRVCRLAAFVAALLLSSFAARTAPGDGFVLERAISLGAVKGRLDHLAIDVARRRLFVAEFSNGSVAAVDLDKGQVWRRIESAHEPQGLAYAPGADLLFIASAGDGGVERLAAADLSPAGVTSLGSDADNIRVYGADKVVVGYGGGGLAVIEAATGRTISDIALPAHPEGFQIDATHGRLYVNLPENHAIAVVALPSGKQIALWGSGLSFANFPMALDESGGRLFVGFRWPALITTIDARTGEVLSRVSSCGDMDDLFYDAQRKRLYASCGSGEIAILNAVSNLAEIARIPTRPGARTSLFVPALDRLFVAAPEFGGNPAEIQVFAPR